MDAHVVFYPVQPQFGVAGVEIPNRVFVGALPYDATEYDLFEFFKQYGNVKDTKIITDKNSGKPKGYGFVTFETEEEADIVRDKGSLFYRQKKINVSKAIRKQGGQFQGSKVNQEYMNGLCQSFSGMTVVDTSSHTQPTKPLLSLLPPHMNCPPQVPELNLHYPPHLSFVPPPPHPSSPGYVQVVQYPTHPTDHHPTTTFSNPV